MLPAVAILSSFALTLSVPTSGGMSTIVAAHTRVSTSVPMRGGMPIMAVPILAVAVNLPPRGKCNIKFKPLLDSSEAVVVKYPLTEQKGLNLNVENQKGAAVCTKDGEGGEKVGDILRYTTEWKLGLPEGDGMITTAASFAGGLSWQLGLFDVAKATSWDEVVEALTSNTPQRTDEIVMVFERPT